MWIDPIVSVYSSADGKSGFFRLVTMLTHAAMDTGVQVSI